MLKILGIIWIIMGVIWVVKPEALRNRLKKKMDRKMKWVVIGFAVFFGLSILGAVIKAEGLILKLIGIAVLVGMARALMFVTSKTSEKLSAWWQDRPLVFFRIWGACFVAAGAGFVFV